MYSPMRTDWRHLANTIELVHPSAQWSRKPKRQVDRFSRFCTAHGRKSLYFTMGALIGLFPKIVPSQRVIWTPSNMIPWAHPSPPPKGHLDRFSRFFCTDDRKVFVYFTMLCLGVVKRGQTLVKIPHDRTFGTSCLQCIC